MKPFSAKKMSILVLLIVLGLLSSPLGMIPARAAGVLYVMPDGTGDCSSWASACDLQTALAAATSGDEIWVAAGTHKPTIGSDREATFQLKQGVALYGGFTGAEIARNQRDYEANPTILSGDLLGNDIEFDNNDENAYHVVTGATDATLDGFTITAGNANGDGTLDYGGEMFNYSSSPTLMNAITINGYSPNAYGGGMYNNGSSPTLTDVTFNGNSAIYGGGMYNTSGSSPTLTNAAFSDNLAEIGGGMTNFESSNPMLTNVTFRGNKAYYGTGRGGGMFNYTSNPILENVTFNGNWAGSGGGMHNTNGSSPTLMGVTFEGNLAKYSGGGIINDHSSPTLTNVTFSDNSVTDLAAGSGGGMYNINSSLTLTNVTFSVNSATYGGGMHNQTSSPMLTNVIIADSFSGSDCVNYASMVNAQNSLIEDGLACVNGTNINNLTGDPMLEPTLANNGGFTQTHALLPGSPAIDAGTCLDAPTTDQRGIARPQGAGCDIGAFEYVVPLGAFEKLGPTEDEADVSLSPTFSWQTSSGATSYEYCYSSVPGPCTKWNSVGTETSVNLSGLAPGYTYYWQARAVNPGGVIEADAATWWSFTTTTVPPNSWPPYTLPGSATFGDTPATHWAWDWIERLYSAGITGGCGSGSYCPEEPVTRAQIAIFLLRGIHGSGYTPPTATGTIFADVPITYWAANWIEQFYAERITGGCGAGVYCPDQSVTRAQMAIFLLRAKHGSSYSPPDVDGSTGFGDVPTGPATGPPPGSSSLPPKASPAAAATAITALKSLSPAPRWPSSSSALSGCRKNSVNPSSDNSEGLARKQAGPSLF